MHQLAGPHASRSTHSAFRGAGRSLCAAAATILLTQVASAQQQALEIPAPFNQVADDLTVVLEPSSDAAFSLLQDHTAIVLRNLPVDAGRSVTLELRRLDHGFDSTQLWIDGEPQQTGLALDGWSAWKGTVRGQAGSDVYLGFSPNGTHGWIDAGDELYHVISQPRDGTNWNDVITRVVSNTLLNELGSLGEYCMADQVDGNENGPAVMRSAQARDGEVLNGTLGTMVCTIAIETDYQLFEVFGALEPAQDYLATLLTAMRDRYLEQINTIIEYTYLNFYTTPADPWDAQDNGGTTLDVLYEFQEAWAFNIPTDADLAHLFSGASIGGGIAWVGVLCNDEFNFAVSGHIDGGVNFPVEVSSSNWDFIVITHETGHNFGTWHTHDYCPPIDECAPNGYWGDCQDESTCTGSGTVMSYCHLCHGGTFNITTYFHDTVAGVMSNHAQGCLTPFCDLPVSYCASNPNSTGNASLLDAAGSPYVEDNDLTLTTQNVPRGRFGYYLFSGSQVSIPGFGGSQGVLCLGAPQYRFAADILNSAENPLMSFSPDLTNLPGDIVMLPGEAWNFQLWYRDLNPDTTSNTSDGVMVRFCLE